MSGRSAGILLFRATASGLRVLLAHPGGPLWKHKDLGAWSIPKGEYTAEEDPLVAALREFQEETGLALSTRELLDLGEIRQKSGKRVTAWAAEGDFDPAHLTSNDFEMRWPPKSGRTQRFPEVDRAEWFDSAHALDKINMAQAAFITRLQEALVYQGRLDSVPPTTEP